MILAEREGFEPSVRYSRTPDFESAMRILRIALYLGKKLRAKRLKCLLCGISGKNPRTLFPLRDDRQGQYPSHLVRVDRSGEWVHQDEIAPDADLDG